MTHWLRKSSEQGLVLVSSLAILLGLMLVGLGVGTMLQNDFRTTANLRGSIEALYYSSAGIEWGKGQIAHLDTFPPVLPIRQMAFAAGSFTVASQSTSVIAPLSARVVLRSVGNIGSARQRIQAQITKTYDLSDAALALRGNGAPASFGLGEIFISGADHDESGTRLTPGSPRHAISTGPSGARSLLAQAIADRPDAVDQTGRIPATGESSHLPSDFISQFANEVCAAPLASKQELPSAGELVVENQVWGTRIAPQLLCIEGRADVQQAVTMAGNVNGAGILVVRHAELLLSGSFRWDGLVVITGNDIGFKATGADDKLILGAVVVNETGIAGAERKILDLAGSLRVLFSRATLSKTVALLPPSILQPAYRALPAKIVQNYWRADPG